MVSQAMTQFTTEMTCPYDGVKFTTTFQGSGTSFDVTLDLQQVGAIMTPWPLATCPTNGFVFYKDKFSDAELETLRPFVLSDEYQALRDQPTYYRAAWLLDHAGASHWQVTWALVQANWQNHAFAAKILERLPQDIAEAKSDQQITLKLLDGDLLRQFGRLAEAKQVFDRLLTEIDPLGNYGLVARYEIALVNANDTSGHMRSAAFKMFQDDPEYKRASRVPIAAKGSILRQSLVVEPQGLDFPWVRLKGLIWSEDASALFANTHDGIVLMDATSGRQQQSDALRCDGCMFKSTEVLIAAQGSVFALGDAGSGAKRAPTLKLLAADNLDVKAAYKFEEFLSPALLAFNKKAIIYDIGSGVEWRDLMTGEISSLGQPPGIVRKGAINWLLKASDPTGPRLAVYRERFPEPPSLVVWDYTKNSEISNLEPFEERLSPVAQTAFSPDGKYIYVANQITADEQKDRNASCELSQWGSRSGRLVSRQSVKGENARLSVASDGRSVAMACGQTVTLWRADLKQSITTLTIHGKGSFFAIAFSPDAKRFAVHTGEAVVVYSLVR